MSLLLYDLYCLSFRPALYPRLVYINCQDVFLYISALELTHLSVQGLNYGELPNQAPEALNRRTNPYSKSQTAVKSQLNYGREFYLLQIQIQCVPAAPAPVRVQAQVPAQVPARTPNLTPAVLHVPAPSPNPSLALGTPIGPALGPATAITT
ncbi:hypothetical protein AJ78_01023 [Emergomyces pasteurianus Ep9510]|uniref:Uncharacterized protein n=1 Tax=Emergomyces pasteurianus Ep9510 TaxID=1447872 RepID=A0A1J9QFN6_9EURO|nr:hypothetical protein AJ78_01023 [Emergomyces pasteurianus Ep9510]